MAYLGTRTMFSTLKKIIFYRARKIFILHFPNYDSMIKIATPYEFIDL